MQYLKSALVALALSIVLSLATAPVSAQVTGEDQRKIEALLVSAFDRGIDAQNDTIASHDLIKGLQTLGLIDAKATFRSDYRDYYRLKKNVSFLGEKLAFISDEYMGKWIGCCVNPGLGLVFDSKNKMVVEAFAQRNFCRVDDTPYDKRIQNTLAVHCGNDELLSAGQADPKIDVILDTRQLKKDLSFALICKHPSGTEYLFISSKSGTIFADKAANASHGELDLTKQKETLETYSYGYAPKKPYENDWHKRVAGVSINRQSLMLRITSFNMSPKFSSDGKRLPDERWDTTDLYACTKFDRPADAVDQLLKARLGHLEESLSLEEKRRREIEDLKRRQKI